MIQPVKARSPLSETLRRVPRRGYVLAALALLTSLLLVYGYWRIAVQREVDAARTSFVAETGELADLLLQRLRNYELISLGGVSLFASVARPNDLQWKDYVAGLDISRQFPGLIGLGFAPYLTPSTLRDLQLSIRDDSGRLYTLQPSGRRSHYGPVLYLEPANARYAAAIGYDMYAEPARRAAMDASMLRGTSQITAPITLVTDSDASQSGFILYTPTYRGRTPANEAARSATLRGWVYVPLRTNDFIANAFRSRQRHAALSITDDSGTVSEALYADTARPPSVGGRIFSRDVALLLYGRRWTLHFKADASDYIAGRNSEVNATLGVGLIAALLIFGIVLALARTEGVAQLRATRMTESYRRSELRFRSAMRYSTIGTALLDHDGLIVEANPALAELLDTSEDALVGERLARRFVDMHGGEPPLGLSDGEVLRTTQQIRSRDGGVREVHLTYSPVKGNIGQGIANLVQAEDVTERTHAQAREQALYRTLEARVALRTRELTHANQELESFAYSVSHDLRTPLRTIDGFSRLLEERHGEAIGDDGRGFLSRVRKAAARMDELIDALLRVSRVSRGSLDHVALDLSAIANDVVDDLGVEAPDRRVEVSIQSGLAAFGDAPLIRNLLQNLIGNAWKFTAQRSDARIEFGEIPQDRSLAAAVTHEDQIECFVRDNGVGFDQTYAGKLFRPFQRLHGQEDFAGHGIGLASVKRIVERHGGSIQADGRVGEGATFRFTLPRRPTHD